MMNKIGRFIVGLKTGVAYSNWVARGGGRAIHDNQLQYVGSNFRIMVMLFDKAVKEHAMHSFEFNGDSYNYELSTYNDSAFNERTVEVPIFTRILSSHAGKRVLEVGNVLSHYMPVSHTVVDKYERAPGVTNFDIIDFSGGHRYDLVICISTLEHIGFDEPLKEPEKITKALQHIKQLLGPDGVGWFSVPLGYNPNIDSLAFGNCDLIGERHFMRRLNFGNDWVECTADECRGIVYGSRYPCANAIMIFTVKP